MFVRCWEVVRPRESPFREVPLYLKEWKESVDSRPGFKQGEKAVMCLSHETLEGLHITGSIVLAHALTNKVFFLNSEVVC